MLKTLAKPAPGNLDDLLGGEMLARLSSLDVSSRKVFAGKIKGERRSKRRGESVEFADHRPYVSGDDLRHIDWNIYGRLDRFFLKLFLEEEDLSLHVVVDCSGSMGCGEPGKMLFAQRAAAALAYIGLVNMNRVTLSALFSAPPEGPEKDGAGATPGDAEARTMTQLRNLRGRRRAFEMGSWVCGLRPGGEGSFTDAATRVALARQGKGVMVVLSDFFFKDGYEAGLRRLIGRGYDVVCVQVLSPQEVEPDLGGDLRLRDVEDGDVAEVTISAPLLAKYKENLAVYRERLRAFCAARDVALITVRSDLGVDTLVLDYLRSRGVLR